MANMVYPILIFIFAFGAAVTFINETGIYAERLPESGIESTLQQVNDTNAAMLEASKEPSFTIVEQAMIFGRSVVGGVIAIFTLGPMLAQLGFPIGTVGVILSPLGIVLLFWLFEVWMGRAQE